MLPAFSLMSPVTTVLSFEPLDLELKKSVSYGRRRFPTRDDYEVAALASGRPSELVWRDPLFAAAVMRHWHQTGQTGCLFARHLARNIAPLQWPYLVLAGQGDELRESIPETVPFALKSAIAFEECEILSLLFPQITRVSELLELCTALARDTEITMEEDRSHPNWVTVALRLDITGEEQLSWIMAFGPFNQWPQSRRAPITELAIRVKPKPDQLFHKLNQDHAAAHLADTPLPVNEEQMEAIFERTGQATRDVLGGDPDFRSAAKTTFSYPV
ncbi:MAG TPA: hypothetical protein VFM51_12190 [Solirubrobacterales bacterium]|nr:hypothetical protein [Solirubrobacterales bacterium]